MITPEMIGSYIKVFEPEPNLSGVMKYSIQLIIPKSDTKGVAQLKDAIETGTISLTDFSDVINTISYSNEQDQRKIWKETAKQYYQAINIRQQFTTTYRM